MYSNRAGVMESEALGSKATASAGLTEDSKECSESVIPGH
jgi:hypothetical protein